jgi:hypothetical protein
LAAQVGLYRLSRRQYRNLLVIAELFRQQQHMHRGRTHAIEGRIVSISQPHVRPIVRGKTATPVEFGAKISVSVADGFCYVDRLSWEVYNESTDLIGRVEQYRERFGHYPASVHADKLYRSRENRRYCKDRGIRLSGPPLGRPKRDPKETKALKRLHRQDEADRVEVEGKFGLGKRRYSLGRIMARLPETSETVIGVVFLVMGLEKALRLLFAPMLQLLKWLLCIFEKPERMAI